MKRKMNQSQRNNFIVSLAGPNIDMTIVNIEEMNNYCNRWDKFAIVVTEKKTYGKLERLNYSLIANYKKAKPRVVITNKKSYFQVYSSLSKNYHKGLLVVEDDTTSVEISELLCENNNWEDHGVDILLCRNGLAFMTTEELKKANYLRISADPEFNPAILEKLSEIYQEKVLALLISQLFVNEQYDTVKAYIEKRSNYYSDQGISDYIDYYEMNKQLAYFIYFDVKEGKILNVNTRTLLTFMEKLKDMGILPIEKEELGSLAKQITIK